MKNKSTAKILVQNTKHIYVGKVVTQVLGLVVTILVIRNLTVDLYGTFNFLLATYILFSVFAVSPLITVINRYIPELKTQNDKRKIKKLIIISFIISLIGICIILLIVLIFRNLFIIFFKIENFNNYIYPYIFYVLSISLNAIIIAVTTSLLLHKYMAIFNIITSTVRVAVYLIIYIYGGFNINKLLLIEGGILYVQMLPLLVIIFNNIRCIKEIKDVKINNKSIRKRIVKYGLFSSMNELGAGIIGKTSDFFIITAIGNPYDVGLYSFGYRFFGLIYKILPLNNFLTIVRPLYFQKFSGKINKEELDQLNSFIVKIMIPVFLFPVLYFIVFGKSIITFIFDPKYIDAYWVTTIILLTGINQAIFYPIGLTIQLLEKMEYALYSKIIVIFSIIAGIFCMKIWGIIGVAVTTLIGDFLKYVLMFILIRRKMPIYYKFREIINYLYISTFLVLTFFYLQKFSIDKYLFIVLSLIFAVVFLFLLVLFHPFNEMDIKLLRKIIDSSKILRRVAPVLSRIYVLKSKFNTSSE